MAKGPNDIGYLQEQMQLHLEKYNDPKTNLLLSSKHESPFVSEMSVQAEVKGYKDETRYSHTRYSFLVDQTVKQIHELSTLKGGEYAGDSDRLANFRRNAEGLGLSMEQVWAVYAAKHWDAINQYVKDIGTKTTRPRLESIEGRADDLIVYLILFKAILDSR